MRRLRRWGSVVGVGLMLSLAAQGLQALLTGEPLRLVHVIAWVPFWALIHWESLRRDAYGRCLRRLGLSRSGNLSPRSAVPTGARHVRHSKGGSDRGR